MNVYPIERILRNFMKHMNIPAFRFTAALTLAFAMCAGQGLSAAEEEGVEHQGEGSSLRLSAEERESAGIVVDTVQMRILHEAIRVPAEVVINAYNSASVAPRMQAQVVSRHVRLGERVTAGQPLVTLSSVALAEAQGELIVADREWLRVESLGSEAVSERRYVEAQVARQQALAKVLAYGMQEAQALKLLKPRNASKANGDFDLLAPLAGTVLQDDFIVGELVEPGRVLFDISDESVLWVEASVTPTALASIEVGDPARVSVNRTNWVEGTVVQLHHRLNETTRTQGVRIAVENTADLLHPGQFAEAEIRVGPGRPQLAVPDESLTLIQGMPAVFKLEGGQEFHPQAVETGPSVGGWTVVLAGLEEGETYAVEGVFYLKSVLLKSSIGDAH
jgi:cobalt-zinc-cadmium efflux system membrane fusion protein